MSIGIGLIGCGQWGLNYLRAFSELDGAQLVAACDVSPDRLKEARRRNRDIRTTSELSDLIADPNVNAVIIATQATRHFEPVAAALEAGKDVLVEKPMTTDVDEARKLRDLAKSTGRILMVGHVFRYNPAIIAIQEIPLLTCAGAVGCVGDMIKASAGSSSQSIVKRRASVDS